MGTRYLIDTNVIIDFFNGSLPESARVLLFNITPVISVISYVEIFSKAGISDLEYGRLRDFVSISDLLLIDMIIAERTTVIRREIKMKLPDAIIAATALENNLTLVTRNTKDFDRISGLNLIDPYHI